MGGGSASSHFLNPKARSRDIVASASLLHTAPDPAIENALRGAPASRRTALLAQAGLWWQPPPIAMPLIGMLRWTC
jgi:hypothetical protein